VVRIPADHVIHCIRSAPEIALAMIASTSVHLQRLVHQLEQLKAQTRVQRVAEFLLSLCPAEQGRIPSRCPLTRLSSPAGSG
jgi:CRP-like cAMP-binding protein